MDLVSIIISIISLILSLYNFVREFTHIVFEIGDISVHSNNDIQFLFIQLTISNRSKNNITINRAIATISNQEYPVAPNEISLGEGGIMFGTQPIRYTSKTFAFPIKIDSYDSCSDILLIPITKHTIIPKKIKICFKTSRGKKYLSVNYNVDNNSCH